VRTPRFIAGSAEAWHAARRRLERFRGLYRSALEAFRLGDHAVGFPHGTYRMQHMAGVCKARSSKPSMRRSRDRLSCRNRASHTRRKARGEAGKPAPTGPGRTSACPGECRVGQVELSPPAREATAPLSCRGQTRDSALGRPALNSNQLFSMRNQRTRVGGSGVLAAIFSSHSSNMGSGSLFKASLASFTGQSLCTSLSIERAWSRVEGDAWASPARKMASKC